jgi:hypothetical protein
MAVLRSFFVFFVLLFVLMVAACSGKKENVSSSSSSLSGPGYSKPGIVKMNKGEKVILNSPDKFIQIFVWLNYEQKVWTDEIGANTNESTSEETFSKEMDKRRASFFKSLSLGENEFIEYSINHNKEIESFLEKNSEYKKAYEDSLK